MNVRLQYKRFTITSSLVLNRTSCTLFPYPLDHDFNNTKENMHELPDPNTAPYKDDDSIGSLEDEPAHHPAGEVCHLFRLPRELREMIWQHASQDNVYESRTYYVDRIKTVSYPISDPSTLRYPAAAGLLPNTLCANQAINKLIFDESLPSLLRNTTFSFPTPGKFEDFVRQYSMIARTITSIRIRDGESLARFPNGARLKDPDKRASSISDTFATTLNSCPNLISMEYHVGTAVGRDWQWWEMLRRLQGLQVLGHGGVALSGEPGAQLSKVRGVENFRLVVVEGSWESFSRPAEEHLKEVMALPRV